MPSTEDIRDFFTTLQTLLGDKGGFFTTLILLAPFFSVGYWLVTKFWRMNKDRKNRMDLHPFLDEEEIGHSTDYYIMSQCQDRPPEIDEEYVDGLEVANRSPLLNFFLKQAFKKSSQRFYLVLGDAGMGKTTFMIKLFLTYTRKLFETDYQIKFIPLGDKEADSRIDALKKDSYKTILLLDAFDEDHKAVDNCELRFNELILKVQDFRKVIITCRTQFFPNEAKERFTVELPRFGGKGGVHRVNKKYLSPFTDKEVQKYLNKRFGRTIIFDDKWFYSNSKRVKAERLVNMAPTLSVRPMLLDKVGELLTSNKVFKHEYQVFEELVHLWVEREADKQKRKPTSEFYSHVMKFLPYAAAKIYDNFHQGKGLFISEDDLKEIALEHFIELEDIEMKARSLLNRNPMGMIKFSHKTILEYFLAKVDLEFREIDFTSFDFGLKIRDQLLIRDIKQDLQKVYVQRSSELSFRNIMSIDNYAFQNVTALVVSKGFSSLDLTRFKVFPMLKWIYIYNIEVVSLENVTDVTFIEHSMSEDWYAKEHGHIKMKIGNENDRLPVYYTAEDLNSAFRDKYKFLVMIHNPPRSS